MQPGSLLVQHRPDGDILTHYDTMGRRDLRAWVAFWMDLLAPVLNLWAWCLLAPYVALSVGIQRLRGVAR